MAGYVYRPLKHCYHIARSLYYCKSIYDGEVNRDYPKLTNIPSFKEPISAKESPHEIVQSLLETDPRQDGTHCRMGRGTYPSLTNGTFYPSEY